ncbi:hypothetical protein AQUCO_02400147v1 [Aquilegia coerulea]|uniref:Transcription factor IIIC subunit 5 HTH domain-containing protein n=1 Tax=Aquilegia coerulea TaxID=218851 RepID=A0A2G5DBM1_AQUCA|nr:hypothetical protein AQUCO_02400147v1 [Aquilegia coerulea]
MGVIKDGTVSGILPENVGFAVHYPGYPSSTARAIETLGGSQGIQKTRNISSEPLELRFRPEDPYSHPAFGYLRPCSNLLLKISKQKTNGDQDVVISKRIPECSLTNKESSEYINCFPENLNNPHESSVSDNALGGVKKDNQPQMEDSAELAELSAEIVARVSEAYHFNGMVDYQHVVAVHAHAGKNKNKRRDRAEVEPYSEKGPMDIDQEDLMILVPPLFSPKDVPEKIVLKPSATLNSKKKLEAIVKQRWEMQIEPCLAIDFNIKEIPRKVKWENHITQGSDHWNLQMAVSTLFDERPIWPTLSLNHHLLDKGVTLGAHLLRRLLFRTAYYFSTGPYRRLWIRKGYDPRKDPESRVYQRIDFRVPPPLRCTDENSTDKLKHMWKDLCALRVFPCKSQISLQLFELVDDYIQEEIRKPPEETCSFLTGWFSSYVLESLRLRIAVRFLSIYPKTGAESFLKSASVRFEKSKRAHAFKKDVRPKEVEHQQVHKVSESSSHVSKVSPAKLKDTDLAHFDGKDESDDDVENNDGYDDIEEEEEEDEEEELDDYEPYQVDAGDGDIPPHPFPYSVGENISKNYLQELFGSFPSTEAGRNKDPEAEGSDAEYQIFEHDSGDNNNDSDDEDY